MRYFTDAAAREVQLEQDRGLRYELVFDDGTRIEAPDYAALLKALSRLSGGARYHLRVHDR